MNTIRQNSLFRPVVMGASLVVIVAGMRAASSILSPMLLALFLAVLLYPAYRWLLRRGIPTWLTVSIMVCGVTLLGVGLIGLLWISIEQLRSNLFFYTNQLMSQRSYFEEWLRIFDIDAPTLISQEILNRQFLFSNATILFTNLVSLLFTSFFVLVVTVFLLLQTTHLSERLEREWGPANFLSAQVIQVTQRVAHFFTIRVRVNLIVAIGITIWLLILGVDLALLWGLMAFFFGFVMYVGLAIAALPPTLLALAESGLLWGALVVLGVTIINVAIENVLAPSLMAQGLNLAPAVALASLIFWSWVLGPLGFILAIPLTVIVVVILASNPETQWLLTLLTMDASASVQLTAPLPETPEPEESLLR
ncbi:MAG: AI-2E family transporter [Caldilineaceae bacterium]|nr:AI-2E family transporter [Caldilineaceae bacterium]